jgi:predicted acetyltransferase
MTSTSFLVRPTVAFRDSYLDALREGLQVRVPPGAAAIAAIEMDFEAHLASLDNEGQTPHLDRGRLLPGVPSNMFWLVDKDRFIGAVSIRSRIDTHALAHFGGHVGYAIRPSMQRRGYGARQLELALQICRGMGIAVVRVSCAEDNPGSRRVIEKNGGLLLRRCEGGDFTDGPYLMFEIVLV